MPSSSERKTVLITGSSTGIGRATAEYFQAMGWNVAATMRSPERETELNQLENVKCLRLNVLDEDSIRSAMDETILHFGGVDVVVNNAGYGAVGPFEAASGAEIRDQFETNVFGLMNVTRGILPYFREMRKGTLVNVASAGGRMTWPLYTLYHSTKWAVEGFSESLQFELRPFGIKVKIIEPGTIRTDFFGRSQAVLEKSGLSVYNTYVNHVMPNLQKQGALAPGPEIAAYTIFRAATDKSWRLRYQTSMTTSVSMLLRRLLPTRLFNLLVRRVAERKEDRLKKFKDAG